MPKDMSNKILRYNIYIKVQEITANRQQEKRTTEDWQRTRPNKSRRSSKVYSTLYAFVQQEV